MSVFLQIVALLLIVLGVMFVPLPIPLGLILIMAGLALLLSTSRPALRRLRRFRRTRPEVDGFLTRARHRMPPAVGRPLRRSEPWRFGRPADDDKKKGPPS
ncbi:MAG: hypothetical protein ACE363_00480 [Alphaproteobacteria bacterium]